MGRRLAVRIYYEDTDSGGVVYHTNYLKYMERGRTEALRDMGFSQSRLIAEDDIVFAVAGLQVRYLMPAKLDDLLEVDTRLMRMKGARLVFKQSIYRGQDLLVEAEVTIATISSSGRARRLPKHIQACFAKELS